MYVDASSRNGTLGTHPSLHPPCKVGVLGKCASEVKVLNIIFLKHFSYFFKKGVQLSTIFMHFGQFCTFDVLDAFTYFDQTLLLSGVVSFVLYTIANQPNLAHSGSYGLSGQIVINHESHQ